MKIDLKKLFDAEGEILELNQSFSLLDIEQWGEKPFKKPVAVNGKIENRAGVVTLDCDVDFILDTSCSRCLEPISKSFHKHFCHTLVRQLNQEGNDKFILVEDGILNFQELLTADIILELPIRILCNDECKGICQDCGKNLNKEKCECKPIEWADDRVKAAFSELFD